MGVSDPLAFVVLFCCDGAGLGKKIEDSAGFKWRCIEYMKVAMCLLLEAPDYCYRKPRALGSELLEGIAS